MKKLATIVAFIASALTVSAAQANTLLARAKVGSATVETWKADKGCPTYTTIEGKMDDPQLESVVDKQLTKHAKPCTNKHGPLVMLESPGGTLLVGLDLGLVLEKHKAIAYVDNEGYCASACAFAFLAAPTRAMGKSAMMMLHRPYTTVNGRKECPRSAALDNFMEQYFVSSVGEERGVELFNDSMARCLTEFRIDREIALHYNIINVE